MMAAVLIEVLAHDARLQKDDKHHLLDADHRSDGLRMRFGAVVKVLTQAETDVEGDGHRAELGCPRLRPSFDCCGHPPTL